MCLEENEEIHFRWKKWKQEFSNNVVYLKSSERLNQQQRIRDKTHIEKMAATSEEEKLTRDVKCNKGNTTRNN